VLTALDSDVIKTYVELGMGVGIVAQMAYDASRTALSRSSTPGTSSRRRRRGSRFAARVFLRSYIYDFIALFAPALDRAVVDTALAGASG
jgi:LysR family cys regulon transcriptional activator